MFYTALISSHHCSNEGNNNKFITIDICSNYVFLLILLRGSSVTPTANAGHQSTPWHSTC